MVIGLARETLRYKLTRIPSRTFRGIYFRSQSTRDPLRQRTKRTNWRDGGKFLYLKVVDSPHGRRIVGEWWPENRHEWNIIHFCWREETLGRRFHTEKARFHEGGLIVPAIKRCEMSQPHNRNIFRPVARNWNVLNLDLGLACAEVRHIRSSCERLTGNYGTRDAHTPKWPLGET